MSRALSPTDLTRLIQFNHNEKLLAHMPVVSEDLLAGLYGLDVAGYHKQRALFAENARGAARDLLAEPAFALRVDRLPFAPRAVVVGLGDSITDDLQSWLEILRHLLELRRGTDGIVVVNAGVSGETTAQMLARFVEVVAQQPAWVLCMAGTNDARRHGQRPAKTLVSLDETERNLMALRHFAATQTAARWLWLTPATVVEAAIAADPFLSGQQLSWRNDDLAAIAATVRRQPDPCVDVQSRFGRPANPDLLLPDGLHPNLAGQTLIARAVVERLGELWQTS
ncbi:MAG: SGNH/GDSL hydrolase family protein [Thermomicrobiales bacterium]